MEEYLWDDAISNLLDDDEISSAEEGFLRGYEQ